MDSINAALFAPFSDVKKYCDYYYWLEVWFFASFIFALFGFVITGYHKKAKASHYGMLIVGLIFKFLSYAQFRLLYSMCVGK